MDYTSEQNLEMAMAKKELNRTGHPSAVTRIKIWQEEGRPFSEIQKIYRPVRIKPEKLPSVMVVDHPPLTGKGSGNFPWRKFAKEVSDMDPEIIDSMGKTDIITVLRDKGVIE